MHEVRKENYLPVSMQSESTKSPLANSLNSGSVNREPLFAGCLLQGIEVLFEPQISGLGHELQVTTQGISRFGGLCQTVIILFSVHNIFSFAVKSEWAFPFINRTSPWSINCVLRVILNLIASKVESEI